MVPEILQLLRWRRRHAAQKEHIEATITEEGGMVEDIGAIGMLIHSPFPAVNLNPVYLRARCRYAYDRGTWYVCNTVEQEHWVWCSDTGATAPPKRMDIPAPQRPEGAMQRPAQGNALGNRRSQPHSPERAAQ